MSILEQNPGLLKALRGEMTPKFLATRSAAGQPNVVPVVSILPAEDQEDVLFFGNFLLRKTVKNLDEDRRLGVLVITPDLQGWVLKADFLEWQRGGPYVERQMSGSLLRYNAYTGIRNAGVLKIRSVERAFQISKLRVALNYLRARLAGLAGGNGGIELPLPVKQEFARMVAVKVMAWVGPDGYPGVAPMLSLQPARKGLLVGVREAGPLDGLVQGSQVAANILTFEAISYQAKGRLDRLGGSCTLKVEEVYAGGPPIPGGRVA